MTEEPMWILHLTVFTINVNGEILLHTTLTTEEPMYDYFVDNDTIPICNSISKQLVVVLCIYFM